MILLPQISLYLATFVASSSCAAIFAQDTRDNSDTGTIDGKVPRGKVVAFGDSFSDNGMSRVLLFQFSHNTVPTGAGAWTVSDHTWPRDPAYFGHRFSNGPVWVEYLADRLKMELDDYAVGGGTFVSFGCFVAGEVCSLPVGT